MTVLSRLFALIWARLRAIPRAAWAAVAAAVDGGLLAAGVSATAIALLATLETLIIGVPVAVAPRALRGPLVHDPAQKRLGRLPFTRDSRDLTLSRYLTPALPTPPVTVDYSSKVRTWGMLLNDRLGNCTIAAALHMIMLWRKLAGHTFTATDAQALKYYELVDGYNPNDPNTDQGGVERDVLTYWRAHGIAGHKIGAFLRINPKSALQMRLAMWLFGGVYLGVDLEVAQQRQTVWDYQRSALWGGHAVPLVAAGTFTTAAGGARNLLRRLTGASPIVGKVVTWGQVVPVTQAFLDHQCTEAWACVPLDMINAKGVTPQGFNLDQLTADLAALPTA